MRIIFVIPNGIKRTTELFTTLKIVVVLWPRILVKTVRLFQLGPRCLLPSVPLLETDANKVWFLTDCAASMAHQINDLGPSECLRNTKAYLLQSSLPL